VENQYLFVNFNFVVAPRQFFSCLKDFANRKYRHYCTQVNKKSKNNDWCTRGKIKSNYHGIDPKNNHSSSKDTDNNPFDQCDSFMRKSCRSDGAYCGTFPIFHRKNP
jgi:hypothetical protein